MSSADGRDTVLIALPLQWEEDNSGQVALIAADGALIMSDGSREVMPEWLDQIVLSVNSHAALVEALQKVLAAHKQIINTEVYYGECRYCGANQHPIDASGKLIPDSDYMPEPAGYIIDHHDDCPSEIVASLSALINAALTQAGVNTDA